MIRVVFLLVNVGQREQSRIFVIGCLLFYSFPCSLSLSSVKFIILIV